MNSMANTCGGRSISIGEIGLDFERPHLPFAVLIPAFVRNETPGFASLVKGLAERGCAEMSFVGPAAEQAHDAADAILESVGFTGVVTTWHVDSGEACEYFVFAAMAGQGSMVALVASHDEILRALTKLIEPGADSGIAEASG